MNVRLERKDAFTVAGISMEATHASNFGKLWDELFGTVPYEHLQQFGSGQSFGVCYDMQENGHFRYMAGFDADNHPRAKELERLPVPEAEYAVLELNGPVPQCIMDGWAYLRDTYFPEHGLRHAGTPDFEAYAEGDMSAPDYRMELWVPFEKAAES